MPVSNNAINTMPADDLAAMNAALADFDLDGDNEVIEEMGADDSVLNDLTLEEIEEVATAPVDEDTLMDLDLKLEMQESYQDQPAAASPDTDARAEDAKPAKAAKAPKVKKASTGATRVPRDISTVASEFFVLAGDATAMSDSDKDDAKAATLALKPTQKKVAEKFENLFTALSVGRQPSRYTTIAFNLLDTAKTMTSTDLVGTYKTMGLDEGTARSQSGQLMNLLAAVKIADRAGQVLTLRSDSLLAERLRSLSAAAV